jgi:hypothetical protein
VLNSNFRPSQSAISVDWTKKKVFEKKFFFRLVCIEFWSDVHIETGGTTHEKENENSFKVVILCLLSDVTELGSGIDFHFNSQKYYMK